MADGSAFWKARCRLLLMGAGVLAAAAPATAGTAGGGDTIRSTVVGGAAKTAAGGAVSAPSLGRDPTGGRPPCAPPRWHSGWESPAGNSEELALVERLASGLRAAGHPVHLVGGTLRTRITGAGEARIETLEGSPTAGGNWRFEGRFGIRFPSDDIDVDTSAGLVFAYHRPAGGRLRFASLFIGGDRQARLVRVAERTGADPKAPLMERLELEEMLRAWPLEFGTDNVHLAVERHGGRWRLSLLGETVLEVPLDRLGAGEGAVGVFLFDEGTGAELMIADLAFGPPQEPGGCR